MNWTEVDGVTEAVRLQCLCTTLGIMNPENGSFQSCSKMTLLWFAISSTLIDNLDKNFVYNKVIHIIKYSMQIIIISRLAIHCKRLELHVSSAQLRSVDRPIGLQSVSGPARVCMSIWLHIFRVITSIKSVRQVQSSWFCIRTYALHTSVSQLRMFLASDNSRLCSLLYPCLPPVRLPPHQHVTSWL